MSCIRVQIYSKLKNDFNFYILNILNISNICNMDEQLKVYFSGLTDYGKTEFSRLNKKFEQKIQCDDSNELTDFWHLFSSQIEILSGQQNATYVDFQNIYNNYIDNGHFMCIMVFNFFIYFKSFNGWGIFNFMKSVA